MLYYEVEECGEGIAREAEAMKRIGRKCNKLYRRLGINRTASQKEIKAAYREMAREVHPDAGGSNEEFIKVQEAYHVLSDKARKRNYDQTGEWISTGIPEQTRINQKANDILAMAFSEMINGKKSDIVYFDVIGAIKKHLRDNIRNADEHLDKIKGTLEVANTILDMIEYSGESINVFEGVLFNIIRENEVAKASFLENKEGFKAALELIKKYGFRFKSKDIPGMIYKIHATTSTSW